MRGRFLVIVLVSSTPLAGCHNTPPPREARFRVEEPGVAAQYDEKTGRLRRLEVDTNKDGRVDTWSYMDGDRVEHIESDTDGDGTLDRWEYYTADHTLEKVGSSRAKDGVVDTWIYRDANQQVVRRDLSTKRDGKADRIEFYDDGQLARVESDSDGDGRVDKWETFDPPVEGSQTPVLRSVAFDPDERGRPRRRIQYHADGSFDRLEVDEDGNGVFTTPATL
ncbi:MAG: hypothetical protein GEU99_00785 [Luteitalea sp.]|nr:hypothetical protein [Luteitalea sp.]